MVFKKMQIFDRKLIHTSFCFPRNVRVKLHATQTRLFPWPTLIQWDE